MNNPAEPLIPRLKTQELLVGGGLTPQKRLLAVLRGDPTDRVPLYAQVPFAVSDDGMHPGAFHGYDDYDDWRARDPAYRRLVQRMQHDCDNAFIYRPPCMDNDQFFIPQNRLQRLPETRVGERVRLVTEIHAGGAVLRQVREVKPGTGHTWQIEHCCKSADDARRLLDEEWVGAPVEADDFEPLQRQLGELGVMWVTIPSPIMSVCRLFEPMDFLVFCRTESALIERLMQSAQERIARNLAALIGLGVGPVVRFGGAEHATPPLMSPSDFDDLVVAYDQPLVSMCRQNGLFVAYHCHGNIRHALKRFREMGVNQTDPVEASPDGDVTAEEARRIAGPAMVLVGNVQCRELFSPATPEDTIRRRVHDFIRGAGPGRVVISTTGTPLEPIAPYVLRNYGILFDAAREYGD